MSEPKLSGFSATHGQNFSVAGTSGSGRSASSVGNLGSVLLSMGNTASRKACGICIQYRGETMVIVLIRVLSAIVFIASLYVMNKHNGEHAEAAIYLTNSMWVFSLCELFARG